MCEQCRNINILTSQSSQGDDKFIPCRLCSVNTVLILLYIHGKHMQEGNINHCNGSNRVNRRIGKYSKLD